MEIKLTSVKLSRVNTNAVVLLLSEEQAKRTGLKAVATAVKNGDFSGKQDEMAILYSSEVNAKRLVLVGLGKEDDLTLEKIRRSAYTGLEKVRSVKLTEFSIAIPNTKFPSEEVSRAVVDGVMLGNYIFDKYITEKERKLPTIKQVTFIYGKTLNDTAKMDVEEEKLICDNQNLVRELVNENSDEKNPVKFASLSQNLAEKNKLKCKVLTEKEMRQLGMNLILGVSRGSRYAPRLVVIEYTGNPNSKDRIALVGKGITFDSGGLNLKPSGYLETMKDDMAGAAAVLGTLLTAAKLGLKRNVVGVLGLAENMIGTNAQKPGDIIKSYSGIGVEVANTDAEGRLVLGDVIAYTVEKYKPSVLIDIATLTGAIVVTFGDAATGVMGNDDKLIKKLFEAGERTYERVWQLPIYDECREDVKSENADIKNIGFSTRIRYADSIAGAVFIEKFVGNVKWAHLDLGGTAFLERQRYYLRKGATGVGVRLLTEFLRS